MEEYCPVPGGSAGPALGVIGSVTNPVPVIAVARAPGVARVVMGQKPPELITNLYGAQLVTADRVINGYESHLVSC